MIRLGVVGTSTGVGKTVVAAGLAAALRERGLRVAAMKPIETGVAGEPSDASVLRDAAGGGDPLELVCPIRFEEPVAPMVAAQRTGRDVNFTTLDAALERIAADRDALLVESAGGLMTPLTETAGYHTLFRGWNLELLVVAGNLLGVLNHTLLTLVAAREAGLTPRAIALNALAPAPRSLAEETNREALERLFPEIPVVSFPWVANARDYSQLAHAAESSGLAGLISASVAWPNTVPSTRSH